MSEDAEPVGEPTARPPLPAGVAAVAGAVVATAAVATASIVAFGAAGLGAWVVIVGLVLGRARLVTAGTAVVFSGVLLAGILGAPPLPLLVGAIGTAVVYDAGHYALRLGTQLGRTGSTELVTLVHVGATVAVATGAGFAGYLVFELGAGNQPSSALIALLVAALLFVAALHSS